jgi:hypothetical protein
MSSPLRGASDSGLGTFPLVLGGLHELPWGHFRTWWSFTGGYKVGVWSVCWNSCSGDRAVGLLCWQ